MALTRQSPNVFFPAGRENLKFDRGILSTGDSGKIRPDDVIEKMAADIFNDTPAAANPKRGLSLREAEIVRQKHDVAHVVQMGMRDQNAIDEKLLPKRQDLRDGARVDQDVFSDEKTGRIVIRQLRAVATQNPYFHVKLPLFNL